MKFISVTPDDKEGMNEMLTNRFHSLGSGLRSTQKIGRIVFIDIFRFDSTLTTENLPRALWIFKN